MKTKEEILDVIDKHDKLSRRVDDIVDLMLKKGLITGRDVYIKSFDVSRDKKSVCVICRDYYEDGSIFDYIPLSWITMSGTELIKAINQEQGLREEKRLKEEIKAKNREVKEKEEQEYSKYLKLKEKYENDTGK